MSKQSLFDMQKDRFQVWGDFVVLCIMNPRLHFAASTTSTPPQDAARSMALSAISLA